MPFSKDSALERLTEAHRQGRLAHAYLLSGPAGSGKAWLATRLAAMVLETDPEHVLGHPDAHVVQPESKSRRIVIDQIRRLEHAMQRKPLRAAAKVAIIHDADRMQPQAANAFLKTLEEPPPGSLILLLSALPEAMLETVLSRCVDTPLHHLAGAPVSPQTRDVLAAIDQCFVKPKTPGVGDAFRFTRAIQRILAGLRESIGSEFEAALREETSHYRQSSDSATWLSERAEQIKALTESAVLRERERILQTIADAFGSALRAGHGVPPGDEVIRALADRLPPHELLRCLDVLETLRRRLALGTQETLALEAGFLGLVKPDDARRTLT